MRRPDALAGLPYRDYLRSEGWRRLRRFLLHLFDYTCQRCGGRDETGRGLQVHHRTYAHLGDERPGEVEVLCTACHRRHHRPPVRGAWARVHEAVRLARIRLGKVS